MTIFTLKALLAISYIILMSSYCIIVFHHLLVMKQRVPLNDKLQHPFLNIYGSAVLCSGQLTGNTTVFKRKTLANKRQAQHATSDSPQLCFFYNSSDVQNTTLKPTCRKPLALATLCIQILCALKT